MPFQRKIKCRIIFTEDKNKKHYFQEFEINEYPTYQSALEMACNMAKCHNKGALLMFDEMSVSDAFVDLIASDELGKTTERMSEKLYLSNVRTLLNRLEEETEGFRNSFDDILGVMIEETSAKLDALNRKK